MISPRFTKSMKASVSMRKTSASFFVVLGACCAFLMTMSVRADLLERDKSNLSREPGAIYLEDFLDKPVKMQVKKEIPIFATSERTRSVGVLKAPRFVDILAMKDNGYRIRAMAQHGQVAGWVLAEELSTDDKNLPGKLRKMYERQLVVQELIDNGQVALGMTIDEVQASLGKPSRKSSRLDKDGRHDVYDYVTYEKIPQYRYVQDAYGRLIRQTYYIKVETGKVSISFKNENVESIEEKEGEPQGGSLKIVPIPIELF